MGNDETLNIIVKLQDQASKALDTMKGNVEKLQPAFQKMAAIGTVAFTAITAVAVTSFKAFADAEAQTVVTNQALQNSFDSLSQDQLATLEKTLGNSTDALGALKDSAQAAGKAAIQLGFDDETAANSFAKLFGATKSVAEAQKELAIAEDLARYKNISLEEATQKLILVHAGATKELKALGLAVDDGATAMQNIDSIMKQTTGTAVVFSKTAAGAMQIMKVNADNLKESIGGALKPAFDKLKTTLVPLVQKFVDWAEKNPELLEKIILIGGAVTGLIAAVGILGMAIGPLTVGLGFLATAASGVAAAFVAVGLPIILIIAAIALLVVAIILIIKHWDKIKEKTLEVWNELTAFLSGVWDSITDAIIEKWEAVKSFFSETWEKIKQNFLDKIAEIQLAWNTFWQNISDFVTEKWTAIKDAVSSGWNWMKEKFSAFAEPIKKAWNGLWDGLTSGVTTAWEGVKKTIKDSINWIIEKINVVINAINTVAQKGAKVIGFNAPQIPNIPLLAEGGIVNSPTLAMIGEAGPEAVIPLSKMNSLGGGGINITINNPEFRTRDDESRLRRFLDDYFRTLMVNHKIS